MCWKDLPCWRRPSASTSGRSLWSAQPRHFGIRSGLHSHRGVHGATPEALAALHQQDLAVQSKYGVRYLKYWYDAATGKVFCLSEAPSREAALAVHREAHGEMPDEIFEVQEYE